MSLDQPLENYSVTLHTEEPRKEIAHPLPELLAAFQAALGAGQTFFVPGRDDLSALEKRIVDQIDKLDEDTKAALAALVDRVVALEQRPIMSEPDDGTAAFAARFAPGDHPAVPPTRHEPQSFVLPPDVSHTIANLQAQVGALTDALREKDRDPGPSQPPLYAAIDDIKAAARERRARAAVGGDGSLTIKMAEVAHLAQSAQEGAISLIEAQAEAEKADFKTTASKYVEAGDSYSRVCVRSHAIETLAISELMSADEAMIATIRDATIASLNAIKG